MAGRSGFILVATTAGLAFSDVERIDAKNYDMTDESIMPFGKYKGEKMANVPPDYLLWMLENLNSRYGSIIYNELKAYLLENKEIFEAEINYKNKSK